MKNNQDKSTGAANRKLWRRWIEASEQRHTAWAATGYRYPAPPHLPLLAELRGMECGATTRAVTPCKRRDIYRSGRCKLHGGMSTGPRTDAGKAKSATNGRRKPHENG